MNTQTHVLVNMALLKDRRADGSPTAHLVPAFWGSIAPDILIFLFFAVSVLTGASQQNIWEELYFQPGWQRAFSVFNSIPLYALMLVSALWFRKQGAAVFTGAALIHVVTDFVLHHDDAHAHFFPFSDWRFASPVSYWDPNHHGRVFVFVELALGLAATVLLFRYLKGWKSRTAMVFANLLNAGGAVGTFLFFG